MAEVPARPVTALDQPSYQDEVNWLMRSDSRTKWLADKTLHYFFRLLLSGHYSDCSLSCGNTSWALHRSVLSRKSEFFEKIFTTGMMETTSKEICIKEHDSDIIMWMILYIYRGSFRTSKDFNPWAHQETPRSPLETFVLVYACACEYRVDKMDEAALKEINKLLKWATAEEFVTIIPMVQDLMPDTNTDIHDFVIWHAVNNCAVLKGMVSFEEVLEAGGKFVSRYTIQLMSMVSNARTDQVMQLRCRMVVEEDDASILAGRDQFAKGYPLGNHMLLTHLHQEHPELIAELYRLREFRCRGLETRSSQEADLKIMVAERALGFLVMAHARDCKWNPDMKCLMDSCDDSAGSLLDLKQ